MNSVIDELRRLLAELRFMRVHLPNLQHRVSIRDGHITEINLNNVSLDHWSHFPISITRLPELKHLQLRYNYLDAIPDGVQDIPNLECLDLSTNQITEIENEIINLKRLKELNLKGNHIQGIPELPKTLERINLSNNRISNIPNLTKLSKLTILSLAKNKIQVLPENHLPKNLEILNLRSNLIEYLPQEFPSLKKINIYNNPIKQDTTVFGNKTRVFTDHKTRYLGGERRVLQPRTFDLRFERFYPPQFGLAMSAIPFTPIMVYGDKQVGKRNFLHTFLTEKFVPDEELSIIQNRYQNWDHYIIKRERRYYQIWYPHDQDLNDPNYRSGIVNGFYYASVFMLMFDVTDTGSFKTVIHAIRRIAAFRTFHTPIMVIGNKIDLRGNGDLSPNEITNTIKELEVRLGRRLVYFETSAETGENIEIIFDHLFSLYST